MPTLAALLFMVIATRNVNQYVLAVVVVVALLSLHLSGGTRAAELVDLLAQFFRIDAGKLVARITRQKSEPETD